MAHEKERAQYEEDREKYEQPWALWKWRKYPVNEWRPCGPPHPAWKEENEYRRKEPPFTPEYYSGLNWREAEKLVGKVVEFSEDGEKWKGPAYLYKINPTITSHRYVCDNNNQVYIRTCPETHAHLTITIGGVELPRPETDAPEYGTPYWTWGPDGISCCPAWKGRAEDETRLRSSMVHLAKDRAQAWTDWWENLVVKAISN